MSNNAQLYMQTVSGMFPSQELYFSVHRKITYEDGHQAYPGQAFKNIDQAVKNAFYWAQRGHDVYLAMGGEKDIKEAEVVGKNNNKFKYLKAIRQQYNISSCSSLYIDSDVKPNEPLKGYASTEEANTAMTEFIKKYNLPQPTMIVASGTGGMHTYWTAEELFSPEEFFVLSQSLVNMANEFGLKFDQACTTDICRLLRIPDTWNFKQTPALPVKLLYSGSKLSIDVFREKFHTSNVVYLKPTASSSLPVDDNDDLMRPKKVYELSDMNLVATHCEFLHNTLMTGGRDQKEPVWKQAITLSTYCKDGRDFAHKLSQGHGAYTPEETDFKYDQAELDKRHNPRLGPPHCRTISSLGVSECTTCRYLNFNATPINTPTFSQTPVPVANHNINYDLPTGYYRDKNSNIWLDIVDKESGQNAPIHIFPYPLILNSAFAEGGEKEYQFVFTTLEGNNRDKIVKIPMSASSDKTSLAVSLSKFGLPMTMTDGTKKFMTTFMSQLRSNDKTLILTSPLGWHSLPSGEMGFSYNGTCYFQSSTRKAQRLDGDFAKHYSVAGSEVFWRTLSDLIITQNRPEINTVIAASFGAPLMKFTGHTGCALGIWSSQSGIGKSTALALAQSVWGSTIRMSGLNDTLNQTIDTMATLKNIACCWDELKGQQQIQQFAQIIFELSRGREKGRLDKNSHPMPQREFETMLIWTSNQPLADEVAHKVKGTAAGNYRLLEFNADDKFITGHNVTHVSSLVGELRKNYGHVGERYAKYLGENHDTLKGLVIKVREHFEDQLKATQAERYWVSMIACIYVGARIANGLKLTKFDLPQLKNFLVSIVKETRDSSEKTGSTDLSKLTDTSLMLGELLAHYQLQTVKTDTIVKSVGRPGKGAVKVLNESQNLSRQNIVVQISKSPLTIRVSDPAIGKWCKENNMPKSQFISALQKHYVASASRSRVASGTEYVSAPLLVWEIDLSNSPLGQEIEF